MEPNFFYLITKLNDKMLKSYLPLEPFWSAGIYLESRTRGNGRNPPIRGITSKVTFCLSTLSSEMTPKK